MPLFSEKLQEEVKKGIKKRKLANKIISKKVEVKDLDETEIMEMIDFFSDNIKNIDNELEKIRRNIIKMKRELEN